MTKNKKEFVEKEEFRRFVKDVVDSNDSYSECYASVRECYQYVCDQLAKNKLEIAQLKAALGQVKPLSPFLVGVVGRLGSDLGQRDGSAGVVSEDVIAAVASPSGGSAVVPRSELQEDLVVRRPIKTILADIALAGPVRFWKSLFKVGELAGKDIDKHVAATDKPSPNAKRHGFDKLKGGADPEIVHKGSPNVEEGDVGISNSTLRGNTGGEKG